MADHTEGSDVRVRFCPSPTGFPHVGLMRTALFNWGHARHTGGALVFRIEDTDAARDSEESYESLLRTLKWLGIDWDEGPDIGGPYGPYRQSQRRDIYDEVIAKLRETDWVYESFSTNEEVQERHKAAGRDPRLGYDNYDRDLPEEQRAAFRAEGRPGVLRLRMPDETISWNDLIRGEVTFEAGQIPDFAIVRANGDPLYTFVNPVDDALMKITHVLRGEDLLPSTPRQIALYRALMDIGVAERVPEFGHLPYVMGEGNKKLSKRDAEANFDLYVERGFVPEGVLNYLALLGWSIAPDRDVFSPQEFVDAFDVHDVNANPARFDLKKAEAINADHIRLLPEDELRDRLVGVLQKAGVLDDPVPADDLQRLIAAVPLVQTRMQTLSEAPALLGFLFVSDDALEFSDDALGTLKDGASGVLDAAIDALGSVEPFDAETIEAALRAAIVDGLGIKPRLAFGPLRVALSGQRISPPLFESMEILGRESTLRRLQRLRERLAG
ncbi:glutamate--tRNA ligase [Epidermidibacterium keratini]|uniref:Glutamate--tRNA ligase n=1 Tax=Epidermidibacterium keratini TaxID=1891644 RepID=A0A7L4YSM9_9ACTN|nr:glutamate--tRNA ligase [Epidermidibacterium keratini]QHC01789.1 glutamate--tRNA ligase [Epidermidibacterium keratini]